MKHLDQWTALLDINAFKCFKKTLKRQFIANEFPFPKAACTIILNLTSKDK